jgi:hypothetical protein
MNTATNKAPDDEMVIDLVCGNYHTWPHPTTQDPFAAECPGCGGAAAFQVSSPHPPATGRHTCPPASA